ncbi:MAG: GAF domain-containing protein [Bacteroidales bacterium]|nr:GAF domain-containing protein [Bacteroidales bacterium]
MAEQLVITAQSKQGRYEELLPQLKAVVEGESDVVANMANIAACLMETFHFWWVGFYRVVGEELVLGPFQGPLACTRIPKGRGVCGKAWEMRRTIVVPDVDKFPGHIACSSESRSEIVIPIMVGDKPTAVLDIDSSELNAFDETDRKWLEDIAALFTI